MQNYSDNEQMNERGTHGLPHAEAKYACSECDKVFSQNSHLLRHMKSHNGNEMHHCNECDKVFIRKDDYMKHMMSHTWENDINVHYVRTFCHRRISLTSI